MEGEQEEEVWTGCGMLTLYDSSSVTWFIGLGHISIGTLETTSTSVVLESW